MGRMDVPATRRSAVWTKGPAQPASRRRRRAQRHALRRGWARFRRAHRREFAEAFNAERLLK